MSDAVVRRMAEDSRLLDICRSIAGKSMLPYKATLFEKTGKANWLVAFHQDTALPVERSPGTGGWGPSSIKEGVTFSHAPTSALRQIVALRIHLDDSTEHNGPLRVIPDTHHTRITDDDEFTRMSQGNSVACLVGKGGVIAMSPLIFHASSKSVVDLPRRVLHVEYAPAFEIEGVRLAIS